MFFDHHNSSVFESTKGERHEAIEKLIASTLFRKGYYFLLFLSVLIVTPGILLNNTAIVIGGMIIAPLLTPIMLLSLSAVSRSSSGVIHALFVLLLSSLLVPLLSFGLTLIFSPIAGHNVIGWVPEEINTMIYFFVAFCSGIAASFALVKKNISSSIAGVAIVVSLLPPLCTVGIDVAYYDLPHALAALTMFLVNLAGILLASSLAFISLGFVHTTALQEKVLKKEQ